MRSCNKTYTITEYGGFTRGTASYGYRALPEKTLMRLKPLSSPTILIRNRAVELLSLSVRRGIGKIITARNYLG
jgi:5-methylcytosine-specific restriction enzyme subunit McrC